jgi:hypothetical protein
VSLCTFIAPTCCCHLTLCPPFGGSPSRTLVYIDCDETRSERGRLRHARITVHGISPTICTPRGSRLESRSQGLLLLLPGKSYRISRILYCGGLTFGTAKLKKSYKFNICHPEVFNTYINTQWCISQTKRNFVFIIVLRQHVSILIESTSGPSKIQILTCSAF